MFRIATLFILLAGCTTQPIYLLNPNGKTFKQCGDYNMYFVDSSVSKLLRPEVYDAFNHWNKVMGRKVFVNGGLYPFDGDDPERANDFVILVRIKKFARPLTITTGPVCVKTDMVFLESGCLVGSKINILPECSHDPKTFNGLVRQGIGNILGLVENKE